ncbi:LysR family transcriptional regulator [Hoeflea poritis]|uniref:LysR family transcriptional regulator n=1 Tax=Hoeflea poritis TaxID=2993659 RepID=A0ABT4VHQ6_9HYPH|nr:LysR family transcriptional regulator [Hoeflea poritis]MDA4844210.1 LysR family transcriptional regulator [Hoeflea poritis]
MDNNRDLFDGMVIFCAVVDENGFAAAAERLGHSASHISKEVARLEQRLGARLLNRTTRTLSLTEIGRTYYEQARTIVEDAREIRNRIRAVGDKPAGLLRVSVPVSFARNYLDAWLPEFMETYASVRLHIEASDRMADVVAEGFDVVVRAGRLDDTGLIARRLMTTRLLTVASPAYLARHGMPETPAELAGHTLIDFSYRRTATTWEYKGDGGRRIPVSVAPRLVCNSAETELSVALAGAGITRLPSMACEKQIASGALVPILTRYEEEPIGVFALYPSRVHLAAKVRAFVDFLVDRCGGLPATGTTG